MMASHRWSHTPPPRLPYGVATLQSWGFLMTQRHHSLHHVGYKINFAIFTGWCNPMLNYITANWVESTAVVWIWLLLGLALLPVCVCWVQLLIHVCNKRGGIQFLPLGVLGAEAEYDDARAKTS